MKRYDFCLKYAIMNIFEKVFLKILSLLYIRTNNKQQDHKGDRTWKTNSISKLQPSADM